MYASHTNANHIELETTFEEFALDLGGNAVETDMAFGHHRTLLGRHRSCHDGPNRLKASVCLERGIGRVSMSACQGCSCRSLMLKKVAVEEELHFGKHLKGVRASAYTSLDFFLCSHINTEHIA